MQNLATRAQPLHLPKQPQRSIGTHARGRQGARQSLGQVGRQRIAPLQEEEVGDPGILVEGQTVPGPGHAPSRGGYHLEAQDLAAARCRCRKHVGTIQTGLMVPHDHLALTASQDEGRPRGLVGQGGVSGEVVRRDDDAGITASENAELVVQIFERLRITRRVALPPLRRLGAPVFGPGVSGIGMMRVRNSGADSSLTNS